MDIRKLKTLDNAIEIDTIEYHEPYSRIYTRASIQFEVYEEYGIKPWNALTEEAKKTHLDQLRDYLKNCILGLVAKELEIRGLSRFKIKGKPVKYAHVGKKTYLAVLSEEQLIYLKERYDSVLRDIR